MLKCFHAPLGWLYNDMLESWQKSQNEVIVYVSNIHNGYQVQLYFKYEISFSQIEARTKDMSSKGCQRMFNLGQAWLDQYANGDVEIMEEDYDIWVNH
jgi:hypothetical protein